MLLKSENHYTLADALTWGEQDHNELIYGAPFDLKIPLRIHQEVRRNLGAQLYHYAEGKTCEVYGLPLAVRPFEQDGDQPENVDTLVEPDITVVCDCSKLDDIGCKGAPDLVVEILSPWTQRHDRFTKFSLYQRAGVQEYWIVDPDNKTVQVFVLENGYYVAADFGEAGDKLRVNVLKNCTIDLTQVFFNRDEL